MRLPNNAASLRIISTIEEIHPYALQVTMHLHNEIMKQTKSILLTSSKISGPKGSTKMAYLKG